MFDDTFSGSSSLLLAIATLDDNPTTVSVNETGNYGYIEGGLPTNISGILLVDEDSDNSDVTISAVTIEIINGTASDILEAVSSSSNIVVSIYPHILTIHMCPYIYIYVLCIYSQ